ncbi:hypothetical protein FH972_026629 [Carpinus fangiana]|uniref:non-specific serine/threonine protein kinase n=1 Tax=Carpinus fangiana TaxID=176857 RepID=A0A5N6L4Z6_9ROSI|nr:hypothetical protein FH972_026629 [Carpinus fangiana]
MKNTLKEARDQQDAVRVTAEKLNVDPPPYEFLEMIGKGSFGNVFKCRQLSTGRQSLAGAIVAVKMIDTDREDLAELWSRRAENLTAFEKEVAVLVTLLGSGARNVNKIYDAFSFGASLWIVSEYCPGGGINTLMKAYEGKGLQERHIIPIARESAIALKDIHAANYIHRDVKAANILITQDGKLQLCDFGVAGIYEEVGPASKRTTIVGTPHWMPPEMHKEQSATMTQGYGPEVDCWSYGITIYEMVTGHPPHAHVPMEFLNTVVDDPPRLDQDEYPANLCDFVAFCLESDPEKRPSAAQILEHPYIANTDDSHPTATLKELISKFREWESLGGSRASLFILPTGGGPALEREDDDWNFADDATDDDEYSPSEATPSTARPYLTEWDRQRAYQKAERAGERFQNLFDENADKEYEYVDDFFRPQPVMPQTVRPAAPALEAPPVLRRAHSEQVPDNRMSTASGMIDLDEAMMPDEESLPIANTIRPRRSMPRFTLDEVDDDDHSSWQPDTDYTRRATREWKFPSMTAPTSSATSEADGANRRTQDWTFPSSDTGDRHTQDWSFPSSEAPDNRRTQEWTFPKSNPSITTGSAVDPQETRRRTQDWTFSSAMANYEEGADPNAESAVMGTPELDQGPVFDSEGAPSLPSHIGTSSHDERWRIAPSPLPPIAAPSAEALAPGASSTVVTEELADLLARMRVEVARTTRNLEHIVPTAANRRTMTNGSGSGGSGVRRTRRI